MSKHKRIGTYRVNSSAASDWRRSPDSTIARVGQLRACDAETSVYFPSKSRHKTYRGVHDRVCGGGERRRSSLLERSSCAPRGQRSHRTLINPLKRPRNSIGLGNQRAHQSRIGASLHDAAVTIKISRDGGGIGRKGHAVPIGTSAEGEGTGGLTVGRGGGEG